MSKIDAKKRVKVALGAGVLKYENFSAVGTQAISAHDVGAGNWYARFGKRLFDIAFALLLLPLLVPVIGLLWLIARSDGGPGIFGHTRVGKNGAPFKCWKVRSMVEGADKVLADLLESDPAARAEWEQDQKLSEDPRITNFGSFIRKTSLDELPQIFNVLKGDMSFVGPRPVVEDELSRYGTAKNKYLSLKPGITGLWQVSGRNDCSYQERVEFDEKYCESIAPKTDLLILWLTVGTLILRTGK